MKWILLAAVVAPTVLLLAACTTHVSSSSSPTPERPVVGGTLGEARSTLDAETLLIYDVSSAVAGVPASYDAGRDDTWMVVAHCAAPDAEALAIIPPEAATDPVRRNAERGGYDHLLVECGAGG